MDSSFQDSSSLSGKILIASPSMDDSIFEKALIFICAHDAEGTIGVIFNKSLGFCTSAEIEAQLKMKRKKPAKHVVKYPIFNGGPVESDKFFILSPNHDQASDYSVDGQVAPIVLYTNALLYLKDVLAGLRTEQFLLCKGFCGWAPGQLDEEIKENSWIVSDVEIKDIFTGSSPRTWNELIKKVGINNPDMIVPYSGSA